MKKFSKKMAVIGMTTVLAGVSAMGVYAANDSVPAAFGQGFTMRTESSGDALAVQAGFGLQKPAGEFAEEDAKALRPDGAGDRPELVEAIVVSKATNLTELAEAKRALEMQIAPE